MIRVRMPDGAATAPVPLDRDDLVRLYRWMVDSDRHQYPAPGLLLREIQGGS